MAFPTDLHTIYTLVDNSDDVLAEHPNVLSAEIRYIEDKVGLTNSTEVTSIDYFLKNASGAYRTHLHNGDSEDGAQLDWDTCWSDAVHSHASAAEGGNIDLTTGITGLLPIANGGTNSTSGAVLLSGNQTVAGVKTFSSFPITPSSDPTTNYQVATKKYVDDNITSVSTVSASSEINTTSTTYTDMTSMTLTLTTGARPVLILANVEVIHASANVNWQIIVDIDGTDKGPSLGGGSEDDTYSSGWGYAVNTPCIYVETLTAASHTIKLHWKTISGTVYARNRQLTVIQL